jgi:uncharacterized protein (TIGR02996 family)
MTGAAVADALLEACRLAPDDDEPRLVWADAVGGERGELVVIQCDLARGGLGPAEAAARRRRERELLAAHGQRWAGLDMLRPGADWRGVAFRRGFVEAIELDARTFAAHGEAILRRARLLRSLAATGLTVTLDRGPPEDDPMDRLRALLESPAVSRLQRLHLLGIGTTTPFDYDPSFDGHGDQAAQLLVESGALAKLTGLGISSSELTAAGVHHLVASGELEHLEQLWLRDSGHGRDFRLLLGDDAVLAVLAHAPRLRSLDLDGATGLEAFVPALPPVAELCLSNITDETLAALGRSRAAATVETLRLSGQLGRGDGFHAFPRLRVLDLGGMVWFGDRERGARELAAALPSLRRLRIAADAPGALRIIGRALGAQLEELVLRQGLDRSDRDMLGLLDELQAHVAGEVRVGGLDVDSLLL